jgi:hypothetical protein
MKKVNNLLFGYSLFGWINILLLQWLFIRAVAVCDRDRNLVGVGILYFVLPITGWFSGYIPRSPRRKLWKVGAKK